MKNIKILDDARHSHCSLSELGFVPAFAFAYYYAKDGENDLINIDGSFFEREVPGFLENCRRFGVSEFTISSTFSGMVNLLAEFQSHGAFLDGLVVINSDHEGWRSSEREKLNAFKLVIK